MKRMTVSELFKKYDFENILPHLDHLFMVNSGRHFSEASIEVFRDLYKHWTECETKPTKCHIRLVSRWEHTSPSIDMNCHVKEKNVFCYAVAVSEVELAAGLFWEMTYYGPKENG